MGRREGGGTHRVWWGQQFSPPARNRHHGGTSSGGGGVEVYNTVPSAGLPLDMLLPPPPKEKFDAMGERDRGQTIIMLEGE